MAVRAFMLTFFMVILLLQRNFGTITASRPAGTIHPPAIPRSYLSSPIAPPTVSFTINRYKMVQTEAFRPTTPGHSPGVGHDTPPAAA